MNLDRAAWEVVLVNAMFSIFASFMISGGFRLAEFIPSIVPAQSLMAIGFVLLAGAIVCAVVHDNVARARDRIVWQASIAFTWAGALAITTWVLATPAHLSVLLYVSVGMILLLASLCIRASRPRDLMWMRIQDTRALRARLSEQKHQLALRF